MNICESSVWHGRTSQAPIRLIRVPLLRGAPEPRRQIGISVKIMKSIVTAFAAALVASTSVTSAASIEGARDIRMYEKAAQSDVSQMPAGSLVHWQALDSQSLAVWTSNDKPWLVRVDQPCQGLMQADTVALTSRDGNVKVGTDAVELGSTQCRIATIQPVDYSKIVAIRHGNTQHHTLDAKTAPLDHGA